MASERVESAIGDGYSRVYDSANNNDGPEQVADTFEKAVREVLAVSAAETVSDPSSTVTGLETALETIGATLAEIRAAVVKAKKPRAAKPRLKSKARKAARKK